MSSERSNKSLAAYIIGFVLSVGLTLLAYFLVVGSIVSRRYTIILVCMLAVVQLFVQLIFFLHVGQNRDKVWRWVTLGFGVLVVLIGVSARYGSWIILITT